MNELELSDSLVSRLENLFYGHQFMTRKKDSQELHDVTVFAQYIPQAEGITIASRDKDILTNYEESDFESNFPCVIVKLTDRIDNEERSIIMSQLNVKLIASVYDESSKNEGYRDIMNMLSMMRDSFIEDRFIAQKFRVLMPLKSKLIESDSWPLTFGEIELKIETGRKAAAPEYIYGRQIDNGRGIYEGRLHEGFRAG